MCIYIPVKKGTLWKAPRVLSFYRILALLSDWIHALPVMSELRFLVSMATRMDWTLAARSTFENWCKHGPMLLDSLISSGPVWRYAIQIFFSTCHVNTKLVSIFAFFACSVSAHYSLFHSFAFHISCSGGVWGTGVSRERWHYAAGSTCLHGHYFCLWAWVRTERISGSGVPSWRGVQRYSTQLLGWDIDSLSSIWLRDVALSYFCMLCFVLAVVLHFASLRRDIVLFWLADCLLILGFSGMQLALLGRMLPRVNGYSVMKLVVHEVTLLNLIVIRFSFVNDWPDLNSMNTLSLFV